MNELVSIIITTYNRGDLLPEAVDSCLAQTYPNFEVIIVDDGSTDDTAQRVLRYEGNPKVVYHYKKNNERAAARNTGIQLSKGKFVKFLDSDDLLEKDYVSKCVEHFHASPGDDLVHTNCKILEENGTMITAAKKGYNGDVFERLWSLNDISLSAVMMKKTVYEKWGGFDETRSLSGAEDWEYWVRLSKQGCVVGFVNEPLAIIRTHAENGTMNDIDKIVFSTKEAQHLLNEKFPIAPQLNHKLDVRLTYLKAIYSYINGNRAASLSFLLKAGLKNKKLLLRKDFWILGAKNLVPKGITTMAKKMLKG